MRIYFILSLIVLLFSCNDDDIPEEKSDCQCSFVQKDENMDGLIDEQEKAIMLDCMTHAIKERTEIEDNLIGEWILIGHGEGWIPSISQPCGYLDIREDKLTYRFENANIDTTVILNWELVQVTQSNDTFFQLKTSPGFIEGLSIHEFCPNYMLEDATPLDGNMYLYEKINCQ